MNNPAQIKKMTHAEKVAMFNTFTKIGYLTMQALAMAGL